MTIRPLAQLRRNVAFLFLSVLIKIIRETQLTMKGLPDVPQALPRSPCHGDGGHAGPGGGPAALHLRKFEAAVPMSISTMPDSLPQQDSFCRASVNHSEIHVFVFSEEDDSPLIGFASYPAEQLGTLLK